MPETTMREPLNVVVCAKRSEVKALIAAWDERDAVADFPTAEPLIERLHAAVDPDARHEHEGGSDAHVMRGDARPPAGEGRTPRELIELANEMHAGLGPREIDRELKVWPIYFDDVVSGAKTWEVRRNDEEGFGAGCWIRLREWDPERERYTGREVDRFVTYVAALDRLPGMDGLVGMTLVPDPELLSSSPDEGERTAREALGEEAIEEIGAALVREGVAFDSHAPLEVVRMVLAHVPVPAPSSPSGESEREALRQLRAALDRHDALVERVARGGSALDVEIAACNAAILAASRAVAAAAPSSLSSGEVEKSSAPAVTQEDGEHDAGR